jgi:hypothetical protein
MRIFIIFLLGLVSLNMKAQREDAVWILGYGGGFQTSYTDSFGLSVLTFDTLNRLNIYNNQACHLNMSGSNSTLCDSSGHLLFASNAERVYHSGYQIMSNGNNLNVNNAYGAKQPQGVLSLPIPGQNGLFLLLVSEIKVYSSELVVGIKTYKNIIDLGNDEPLTSQVIEKKTTMIADSLEYGQMAAVKHANGRDWWILVPESHSNRYYTMLLDSSGLSIVDTQSVGNWFYAGLGQAVFSPDGSKYVRVNGVKLTDPKYLYIYDFDRCTGKLSNPVYLEYENSGLGSGCAISPNSRFLYAISRQQIWQYDLYASDVGASKTLVAQWDGYIHNNQFTTTFAMAQLAPDGKIYITTPNSNVYLHVIDYPDRAGLACQVRQRAIRLPNYNDYGLPNHPHFRLGPVDGSACDTLGMDNHPLCNWHWAIEDSTALTEVSFLDLSTYEPTTWHWDFGDGSSSTEASPQHEYASEGTYQVCLVVSNQYSADTFCQVLQLGLSAVTEADAAITCALVPNPADQSIQVILQGNWGDSARFSLFDLQGRLVLESAIVANMQRIETRALVAGTYLYRLNSERGVLSGKLLIQH